MPNSVSPIPNANFQTQGQGTDASEGQNEGANSGGDEGGSEGGNEGDVSERKN